MEPNESQKKVVLLIEDEIDLVDLYTEILNEAGFDVLPAYDGEDGIAHPTGLRRFTDCLERACKHLEPDLVPPEQQRGTHPPLGYEHRAPLRIQVECDIELKRGIGAN